jgi:hypothetical protein
MRPRIAAVRTVCVFPLDAVCETWIKLQARGNAFRGAGWLDFLGVTWRSKTCKSVTSRSVVSTSSDWLRLGTIGGIWCEGWLRIVAAIPEHVVSSETFQVIFSESSLRAGFSLGCSETCWLRSWVWRWRPRRRRTASSGVGPIIATEADTFGPSPVKNSSVSHSRCRRDCRHWHTEASKTSREVLDGGPRGHTTEYPRVIW